MTVSQTERLQLYRWTQDTDAFTRIHMDESHENLEDRVARYVSSTTEPVPVANEWARSFWLDTDTNVVYFYTAEDENGTWKPFKSVWNCCADVYDFGFYCWVFVWDVASV